ncbi:hydrogenase maturation nickel metallochaperone HypA [Thermoflexus sp.]|uniref:hydrogenase maturation nickel metallochaperone HypA/HybF n=1 Tax=Thermoflexus sp. TaxID=1969742 RepID=UPI0035E44814
MHELAITQGILSVVLEAAEAAGARRVLTVDLIVGALTGYVDESIRFYFDLLSRGTLAEGAALRIRRELGEGRCQACGARFPVEPPLTPVCPLCGSPQIQVEGGTRCLVERIEVEDGNEHPGGEGDPSGQ